MQKYHHLRIVSSLSNGFGKNTLDTIEKSIIRKKDVIISSHPSGLSRKGVEHKAQFNHFLDVIQDYRSKNLICFNLLSPQKNTYE